MCEQMTTIELFSVKYLSLKAFNWVQINEF